VNADTVCTTSVLELADLPAWRRNHMENSKQIIHYFEELAQVLRDLSVTIPFHLLITGGAYMLLHKKRRFTLDIDVALVESPGIVRPKGVFWTTVQRNDSLALAFGPSLSVQPRAPGVANTH
jgi:hypothetical protein